MRCPLRTWPGQRRRGRARAEPRESPAPPRAPQQAPGAAMRHERGGSRCQCGLCGAQSRDGETELRVGREEIELALRPLRCSCDARARRGPWRARRRLLHTHQTWGLCKCNAAREQTIGEIRHLEGALLRICRTVRRSTSPPPAFWPGLASKIGPTSPIFRATDRSRLSGGRRAPNASQIWCGRFRRRGSFRWLSQRARCLPQPHEQHRDPKGRHPSRFSPCSAHGPHGACCGA